MFTARADRGGARTRRDSGFVTAELAVALPAVVLVLVFAVAVLGLVLDQIRCVDAARLAARAVARGDTTSAVVTLAREAAPEGARVDVKKGPPVRVEVVAPPRKPWLPDAVRARAVATAPSESTT
ncbi:MAG: TadE family type IV pilus minor pilin [Dermatophilus congolensis]|nr:TadE family type IV pilus minor pilin [Dermatophilus congolensis]